MASEQASEHIFSTESPKLITPIASNSSGGFGGSVVVPSSKSISHRALILAALTGRSAVVYNPLRSDDVDLTFDALRAMGYDAIRDGSDVIFSGKQAHIMSAGGSATDIYIKHSGTSARLLTAVAAIQRTPMRIDGSERMRERPMQDLITPLAELGVTLSHERGCLPITIHRGLEIASSSGRGFGSGLSAGLSAGLGLDGGFGSSTTSASMPVVTVNASKSSQFLSALLLIAPLLPHGVEIRLAGTMSSRSYVDMTIAQMRMAGVEVQELTTNESTGQHGYRVPGGQRYTLREWNVEGDYSGASYALAAAAITGGTVHIPNLVRESLQGDRVIVDILEEFGAQVEWHADAGLTLRGNPDRVLRGMTTSGATSGVERDMNTCPDIVPTVAVVALFAETPTRLHNIEHLRYKESDRIAAVIGNIERLGGKAMVEKNSAGGETLVIEPLSADVLAARAPAAAPSALSATAPIISLPTFDDHRMAMCFAVAGLRLAGVQIEEPSCVAKSYPTFWADFERLSQG
jgi:3-phosphoshikimate 1-carboxyvinyltransferase